MAGWGDGARVSNGGASSSSRDLVSPLTVKLQQVWLQTQFRGSSRDLTPNQSPGVENAAATLPSPVALAATTPSSSSESGDDSWGVVDSAARIRNLGADEDAVLQFIDMMLMEDQIEQQACLDVEVGVGAIQAELQELIQTSSPPLSSPEVSPQNLPLNPQQNHLQSSKYPQHLPPQQKFPLEQQNHYQEQPPQRKSPQDRPQRNLYQQQQQQSTSNGSLQNYFQNHQEQQNQPSTSGSNSHSNSHSHSSSGKMKKRSLPTAASDKGRTFDQLISRVSILERQRVFSGSRNGLQPLLPNRPPRLLLQRSNETYTSLWTQLGLDAHLLDKLILCGEAVSNSSPAAWSLIEDLRPHAAAREGNATQRVTFYFLEALIARLHNTGDKMFDVMCRSRPSIAENLKAVQMILKQTPFLGLPHLFTNRIILDSIRGAKKIHIVDFGIMYGLQWPALFQLLAERREGAPQVRITGIDLPPRVVNHNGRIRETGSRLKRCAQDWGISFKFRNLAIQWESVEPAALQLKEDEVLIVCCSFKQTNLFDETVIPQSPKDQWLVKIRQLNPRVFVQCLASSGFGGPMFLPRFQEALVHHAAVFAAMDACISRMLPERIVIEHDKYGREIMNMIACEGVQRVERSETHKQWHQRGLRAGLEILPLSGTLFEESREFARGYNRDLTVGRDGDWMWLGWKDQIIHAYSTWRAGSSS